MAEENKPEVVDQEQVADLEDIKRQLDMIDQRLDNIDSIVTAVVERVMSQPIVLNVTCPHCGNNVDISIIGSKKPGK